MTSWIKTTAAVLLITSGSVQAQETKVPAPADSKLLLATVADGVQVYACELKDQTYSWVFKNPDATIFDRDGRQAGTHFAGPTWKANDGSAVAAESAAKADAPDGTSIPWLLLRAKSHDGQGLFAAVKYVRRAETKGGAAPTSGCDASHAGEQARMRYSAVYQFFN